MTSEKRERLLRTLDNFDRTGDRVIVGNVGGFDEMDRDELRELLQAHEKLEKAKALLFRVDGMGIGAHREDWLSEPAFIRACELERDVAVFIGRPVSKRVETALAAHDARTGAGTAREGGGE